MLPTTVMFVFNPCDSTNQRYTYNIMLQVEEIYDFLQPEYIIIHPEKLCNELCSRDTLIKVLFRYRHLPLIIENMPTPDFLGVEPLELKRIMEITGVGLCLDISHAHAYAYNKGYDFFKYFTELLNLNPVHFHLSDNDLLLESGEEYYPDAHLPLEHGVIPILEILRMLPPDARVILEIPLSWKQQSREIEMLQNI